MAVYIDLNAVRAGIVSDPKDYRFSGYAEACGGGSKAREGIATIFENYGQHLQGWAKAGSMYREQLYVRGEQTRRKAGFAHETVKAVLEGGGKLTAAQALHCRVRYFTDGVVLGGKEFVEDVFDRNRQQFGVKRRKGARPLRNADFGGLCTMRDLRKAAITPSKAARTAVKPIRSGNAGRDDLQRASSANDGRLRNGSVESGQFPVMFHGQTKQINVGGLIGGQRVAESKQ